jgi:hypothetical protein
MRSTVRRIARVAGTCVLALGCAGNEGAGGSGGSSGSGGSNSSGGAGASGGSGGMQPAMCSASVFASDASNYRFSSTITLTPVPVASMSNLLFDWSGLTRDFMGHDLAPAQDLGLAMVMFWDMPLAEFETQLNADDLFTADLIVSPPLSLPLAGATSAHLYDFTINTTPVTPDMINPYFNAAEYPPSRATYIVGVQAGNALGRNLRMMQAFNLDASSTATTVPITNDSMKLAYTVNLHELTSTTFPAGNPALTLDWSHVTIDGFGRQFTRGNVTDAVVGHYAESPAELEQKFLDLDKIALATYRATIPSGFALDFTTLKDTSGANFPGIDGTGTWLVGLFCGNCRNPAPLYMTVLKPCTP